MKNRLLPLCALAAAVLLSACASARPTQDTAPLFTQAAATAFARITETAIALPTETQALPPTQTPVPPTETPAATDAPTVVETTPAPAATATLLPTSASLDSAVFVADVTYPDNTIVNPGAAFDKVWRIRNNGKTTWTTAYSLVCIDAGKLECPQSAAFPSKVKPGDTVDLKIRLTAPGQNGTYKAYFRLRSGSGQYFRLDKTGDLWVQIVVGAAPSATPGASTATSEPTATGEPKTATPTTKPTVGPSPTSTP